MRGARKSGMKVVAIQIENRGRKKREIGDAGFFARLPLRGIGHRRVTWLDVSTELQPELALSMEAEQDVVEVW